ncbi:hypothetical protein EON66_08590 [archaeon]|nr:MAG: hypothetical protein EON66_08590 [archaeon]
MTVPRGVRATHAARHSHAHHAQLSRITLVSVARTSMGCCTSALTSGRAEAELQLKFAATRLALGMTEKELSSLYRAFSRANVSDST